MRLPNWILLFSILFAGMFQYSSQVQASSGLNNYAGSEDPFLRAKRNDAFQSAGAFAQNSVASNANNAMTAELANKAATANAMVSLNSASAEQLSSLPGIGLKKAEAIVAYRELNGEFESVEELVNVKGIGPKMLAKLKGLIAL